MMMEARFRTYFLFVIFGFWNANAQVCDLSGLTLDPMLLIDGAAPGGPYSLFVPVSITCTPTYMSSQESFSLCQGSDTWVVSPDTYTCSAPCLGDEWNSLKVTVNTGQYFTTENVYEHNTVIDLACPEGTLEGANTAICEDGSWSPSRGSIRCNLCGTTELSLDPMLLIDDVIPTPSYAVFQLISMSCQTTYMSNFDGFNICLESGWITPLQDFECLAPCATEAWPNVDVAIITGQHFVTEDVYEHNTILEFSCSSGTLEGTTVSACQRGTWGPATDSVHCNQPCESPDFADPMGTYNHGDVVDFTCLYSSDVYPSATCLDGVWDQTISCPTDQRSTTMRITEAPIMLSTEGTNTTDTP